MGLQFSLQNIADLVKYILTIILSRPAQFRYAALVSFVAVCGGVVCYAVSPALRHATYPSTALTVNMTI